MTIDAAKRLVNTLNDQLAEIRASLNDPERAAEHEQLKAKRARAVAALWDARRELRDALARSGWPTQAYRTVSRSQ